jgi:hypothetical protein
MTFITKYRIWTHFSKALFLMAIVFAVSSCSDENVGPDEAVVTLSCKSFYADSPANQNNSMRSAISTRAISGSTENIVQDLTVYIFNTAGDVIGHNYSSYSIDSQTTISMSITTRAADDCTIYAVANAGPGTFAGVYNKALFDEKYASITSGHAADLATQSDYAIMFGKMTKVKISSGANSLGTITLDRLLSKITFKIIPKNTDTSWPITITGYQLHHVPLSCYYSDTHDAVSTQLTSYGDFAAVAPTSDNTDGKTLTFTYYVYENQAGTNTAATNWNLRNKTNHPSNASYLTVNAQTAIWKSTYYIYLGGKNLTASDSGSSGSTYDYTDFNIYRNTNYTVTVNINGSGASDVRVDYDANIYFGTPGISSWTPTTIDVNM